MSVEFEQVIQDMERRTTIGYTLEQAEYIMEQFQEKMLKMRGREGTINSCGLGEEPFGQDCKRWVICVGLDSSITPEQRKSLKLPKKAYHSIPVRYSTIGIGELF